MLFFKLAVLAAGALIDLQAYQIWKIAKELREIRRQTGVSRYPLPLQKRKLWAAARLGILSVVAYGFIEEWIKRDPEPFKLNASLLLFHILIAFLYTTLISAMICFTGKKYPRMHAIMGFAIFALLSILNGTGAYMLYQLPN